MRPPERPWRVDEEEFCIRDAHGLEVVTPSGELGLRKLITLHRIVAAVNACENLSTTALDRIATNDEQTELALRASQAPSLGLSLFEPPFPDSTPSRRRVLAFERGRKR